MRMQSETCSRRVLQDLNEGDWRIGPRETGPWFSFPLASPSAFRSSLQGCKNHRPLTYSIVAVSQSRSYYNHHNTANYNHNACAHELFHAPLPSCMQLAHVPVPPRNRRRGRPIGQAIIVLWVRRQSQRGWSLTHTRRMVVVVAVWSWAHAWRP